MECAATQVELLELADGNEQILILVALAAARDHALPRQHFSVAVAERLARRWTHWRDANAAVLTRRVARWLTATGGRVERCTGDATAAEAVLRAWPAPRVLHSFRLVEGDFDALLDVLAAVGRRLGTEVACHRTADGVILRCSGQQADDPTR